MSAIPFYNSTEAAAKPPRGLTGRVSAGPVQEFSRTRFKPAGEQATRDSVERKNFSLLENLPKCIKKKPASVLLSTRAVFFSVG